MRSGPHDLRGEADPHGPGLEPLNRICRPTGAWEGAPQCSRLWTGSGRLVLGNTLSALPRMTLTLVCVILADLTDQDLERGDSTDDAALGAGLRAEGQIVLISGEAGNGKSRIAETIVEPNLLAAPPGQRT